jgi:hypothetical protein
MHSKEPWIAGLWKRSQEPRGGKSPRKTQWTFDVGGDEIHSGVTGGEVREETGEPCTKIFGEDAFSGWGENSYSPPSEEDIQRIVACVNACAGIPSDLLQRIPEGKYTLADVINMQRCQGWKPTVAESIEHLEKLRGKPLDPPAGFAKYYSRTAEIR